MSSALAAGVILLVATGVTVAMGMLFGGEGVIVAIVLIVVISFFSSLTVIAGAMTRPSGGRKPPSAPAPRRQDGAQR